MFAFKTKCLLFRSSGNLAMTLFAYLPQKSRSITGLISPWHALIWLPSGAHLTTIWWPVGGIQSGLGQKLFRRPRCAFSDPDLFPPGPVWLKVIIRPHGGWVKCSHVSALSKTLHQKMLPCTRKVCSQVHLSWWADPPWVPCTRLNQVQAATTAIFYCLPLPSGRWCPKHSCNF